MNTLSVEIVSKIDEIIRSNSALFSEAAKTLKEEFFRIKGQTKYPIFQTLTTVARRATEEFRNDCKNATLVLLIAWLTNKSDAKLEILNLQEFSPFDGKDLSDCRDWARITRNEHRDWSGMVNKALCVVQPELPPFDDIEKKKLEVEKEHLKWRIRSVIIAAILVILTAVGLYLKYSSKGIHLTRATPEHFNKMLDDLRLLQNKIFSDNLPDLMRATIQDVNTACERLRQTPETNFVFASAVETLTDAIIYRTGKFFDDPNHGHSPAMMGYSPPFEKSKFTILNSWLQYIENSLKPIDNYLKEEVKKAFYEMGETWVKRLIYAPTYKLWSTTIEKWNMNPQKLFEKITQKLDHKIKKIYEWEYQNKIELKPDEIASFEEK